MDVGPANTKDGAATPPISERDIAAIKHMMSRGGTGFFPALVFPHSHREDGSKRGIVLGRG